MIINQILVSFLLVFFILILPTWNYQLETCCSNETTINNTNRLLSCSVNFVIKLRSAIFYTGNGCAPSACQKRLNKHYLSCNNHRTCSIATNCILMDSSTCSWSKKVNTHSEYLVVDYDCILFEPEPPLMALNRLHKNKIKKEQNENIVLFSAKVNIESPPDLFNDTLLTDDEYEWKEYFLKKYLHDKQFNGDKTILVRQQPRSLLSDILRTVLILIIFAFILIVLMLTALFVHKRIRSVKKRKLYGQQKHQPFPADDAYDNLKGTVAESLTDSGATTDV